MKNTDGFMITVINRQRIDGSEEKIEEKGTGSMRYKDGRHYIKYSANGSTVMIKLETGRAEVHRIGENKSDMQYIEGKTTDLSYKTPYGNINMEMFTKAVDYSLGENGGKVHLAYDFSCNGGIIENHMEINIVLI